MKKPPKSHIMRVASAALLIAALTFTAAGASDEPKSEPPSHLRDTSPTFGCAGTMVIANIDCEYGDAQAFDSYQMADTTRYGCMGTRPHLAPWCTVTYRDEPKDAGFDQFTTGLEEAQRLAALCQRLEKPSLACIPYRVRRF